VVVPINIQMMPQDIGFVVQNSGMRKMVIDESLLPNMAALPLAFIVVGAGQSDTHPSFAQLMETGASSAVMEPVQTPSTDLAFLVYTSGTTGYPKGVMLSEYNVLENLKGITQRIQFNHQDRVVLALPMFHIFGLVFGLATFLEGGSIVLIPKFMPRSI